MFETVVPLLENGLLRARLKIVRFGSERPKTRSRTKAEIYKLLFFLKFINERDQHKDCACRGMCISFHGEIGLIIIDKQKQTL